MSLPWVSKLLLHIVQKKPAHAGGFKASFDDGVVVSDTECSPLDGRIGGDGSIGCSCWSKLGRAWASCILIVDPRSMSNPILPAVLWLLSAKCAKDENGQKKGSCSHTGSRG